MDKDTLENFFSGYKHSIYSEQIGAKLIELNTNTLAELKKLGFYFEIKKDKITVNFLFVSSVKYFDQEFTVGNDVQLLPINSDMPKILIKKEFIEKVPVFADVNIKMDTEEYIYVTHNAFFPKLTYQADQIVLITQPQKSFNNLRRCHY